VGGQHNVPDVTLLVCDKKSNTPVTSQSQVFMLTGFPPTDISSSSENNLTPLFLESKNFDLEFRRLVAIFVVT
jgi:hypothetical protein